MADDTNAAIRGARAGGATEIVVNDSHGSMRNLRLEDLEPGARLISHSFKRHGMMEGLDDSFDAVIFVGYHAKAGTRAASSRTPAAASSPTCASTGARSARAASTRWSQRWYGVPVVLVTGDDVAVKQVEEVATAARTVAVKRAINQRAVELRPLEDVHREIERRRARTSSRREDGRRA